MNDGNHAIADTPTEHPHIVRNPSICGGSPRIRNSRITVRHVALMVRDGDKPEDIAQSYPHLNLASVYDAVSYYLDHQSEIEQEILDNQIENVLTKYGGSMDEKGVVHFPGVEAKE